MNLALFDFDGTITSKDSFLDFILFAKGKIRTYFGLLLLSPILVLWKLGVLPNWKSKQWVIIYFFGNTTLDEFNESCVIYARTKLQEIVRKNALDEIEYHKNSGNRIIVVSASIENYLKPWCSDKGIECVGTLLEVDGKRITGRFQGKNCYGQEKVERIRELLNTADFEKIYAYGDSRGDREMLELATDRYYRHF